VRPRQTGSLEENVTNTRNKVSVLTPNALAACSTSIEALRCHPATVEYCMRHGVAYLGEVARLRFAVRCWASIDREDLERILLDHELSFGIDPVALGWRPPYWDDEEWLAFLSKTLVEANVSAAAIGHYTNGGLFLVGQMIRSVGGQYGSYVARLQGNLRRESFDHLRAGMIVPPAWQPANTKRRAEAFKTEHDCLRAVEEALAARTGLTGDDLGSISDALTVVVQFVGVKELGDVVRALADKLPFIETDDAL
jgi:hypothetical protein